MPYTSYYCLSEPLSINQALKIGGCELLQDNKETNNFMIRRISDIVNAEPGDLTFLSNNAYLKDLQKTKASACIIHPRHLSYTPSGTIAFVSENPYASYAKILNSLYYSKNRTSIISPTAFIHHEATIGENCTISNGVTVDENGFVGDNCFIGTNTYIGPEVIIGKNTYIGHNVTIEHTKLGDDVIIHSGTRIGQDGFGFATENARHIKVLQLGKVIIGNEVEIGSNCCIDRGSGPNTIIGESCKIDNMVQIAHNVKIGKGCLIAAQSGIAGSTTLGNYVAIGGQSAVSGHLNIGHCAQIAGKSGVMKDIKDKEIVGGYPAVPIKKWHRQSVFLRKNS